MERLHEFRADRSKVRLCSVRNGLAHSAPESARVLPLAQIPSHLYGTVNEYETLAAHIHFLTAAFEG